jgi:TetR/AcrR family transcriptional regulator, transcriptional repressor for nem operon
MPSEAFQSRPVYSPRMYSETKKTTSAARPDRESTREQLLRTGVEAVLEGGWASTGIDKVLKTAGVPKGSFYYYFSSKDEFGFQLIDTYQAFYLKRLERCFGEGSTMSFGERMGLFLSESVRGMQRYSWRRGCLVGALGQELGGLHPEFRKRLLAALTEWEEILAASFRRAQSLGELKLGVDPERAARGFWASWEGAVLQARLSRSADPLKIAVEDFCAQVIRS